MKIAILGATSQIARGLLKSFSGTDDHDLLLYARDPAAVAQWLQTERLTGQYRTADYAQFGHEGDLQAIINFVGVGSPAQAQQLGASILDITAHYDQLALDYLRHHAHCRYLFLSSGAAYGDIFDQPATADSSACVPINRLQGQDWYGIAKLYAEARHRAAGDQAIVDLRVFSYVSTAMDRDARFLISDIFRAIQDRTVLQTSSQSMVRDYLHPSDFHRLISLVLAAAPDNLALDCYSAAPVEKFDLLRAMHTEFGLNYEVTAAEAGINATGAKTHYYSNNRRAAQFGYHPAMTSLDGIRQVMQDMLARPAKGQA